MATRKDARKLESAKSAIVDDLDFIEENINQIEIQSDEDIEQLIAFRDHLDELSSRYSKVNTQLAISQDYDRDLHRRLLLRFIAGKAKINALLKENDPSRAMQPPVRDDWRDHQRSPQSSPIPHMQSFRLPEIPMPKFAGDFQGWLDYKSAFQTMVADNPTVTESMKFYYLRQSLSGEAFSRIQNIPSGQGDFHTAWRLLCERYDNSRLIASSHVTAIEAPPAVKKNCASSLRAFIDHCKSHITALESLELNIDVKDLLYTHKMLSQLDPFLVREWERRIPPNTIPALADFWEFLECQCKIFDACSTSYGQASKVHSQNATNHVAKFQSGNNSSGTNPKTNFSRFVKPVQANNASDTNASFHCFYCKDRSHTVYKCPLLLKVSPKDRINEVRNRQLCIKCLYPDRPSHSCASKPCYSCGKGHNSILHYESAVVSNDRSSRVTTSKASKSKANVNARQFSSPENIESDEVMQTSNVNAVSEPASSVHTHVASLASADNFSSVAVLPTVEIYVEDYEKRLIKCTALLDSGSDCNLVTQKFANKLNLPAIHSNTSIHSIGDNEYSASIAHDLVFKSNDLSYSDAQHCIVVDKISQSDKSVSINLNVLKIPNHVKLANPDFHLLKEFDVLLGAGVFASVLMSGQISIAGPHPSPSMQQTKLGWIIFGHMPTTSSVSARVFNSHFIDSCVSQQLENFWKIEEIVKEVPESSDKIFARKHYDDTAVRQEDGRFMVSLPKRENFDLLGQSHFQALKRFHSLEKRLARNPELKAQYTDFMSEYEDLNHMTKVTPPEDSQLVYYIPHHPVLKMDSSTTKLRVVFDASAKTSTSISLNEVLHVGPTVQSDIFDIILRFRIHPVALSADVAKMYRQVLLNPADRDLHRIFWRKDPSEPINEYQLNTVTYGTTPAAFLATHTLNNILEKELGIESPILDVSKKSFYVDDFINSSSSESEAIALVNILIPALDKGGMELRKWRSNSPAVMAHIPPHLQEASQSDLLFIADSENSPSKALGLHWNSSSDKLSIASNISNLSDQISFTKRQFLSCIASIFDPLGLISPIVILPKILFQTLWLLNLDWDDLIPDNVLSEWLKILKSLPNIAKISIPRCAAISNFQLFELHGFSDASKRAYGACVYVRSINADNVISVNLLCSKSKVAPLKPCGTPRLELLGALLLSRLISKVINAFPFQPSNVFLWSDSSCVISWLKSPPDRKEMFEAVRIAEIQEATSSFSWSHVKTKENPADIASRGALPHELVISDLWWHGPKFLSSSSSAWTKISESVSLPIQCTSLKVSKTPVSVLSRLFDSCSSSTKMIRATAYVFRFINNLRNKNSRSFNSLSVEELSKAESVLIKTVQAESFSYEMDLLRNEKPLPLKHKLLPLNPFIHKDGFLRVGGRLEAADVPLDFKHQMLLPNKHKFTKALIIDTHNKLLHAGAQATMASLRQRFWFLSTRLTVKGVLRSCIPCFRFTTTSSAQLMGDLPSVRVNSDVPFLNSGVDFAGPFELRLGNPKSRTFVKAYLALFICLVSRAVHCEVVTELSTKAFLAALSRFVARRGLPNSISSDNATNFQGANAELRDLSHFLSSSNNQRIIQAAASGFRIQWNFIPPRAPHMGGLWESAIKSFKQIFKIVYRKQVLNLEEFFTVAAQVEAILNSRPMIPLSEDPSDLAFLSPGHFLIGRPVVALPSRQPVTNHIDHVSRWRRIASFNQELWNRWTNEYLVTLQKRQKWSSESPNIKVGILVLLKDKGTLPTAWKLGRVTQVFPGSDGKVRVVLVQTEAGIFKRSIVSIAPLPLEYE